jgi:hypothetical protein
MKDMMPCQQEVLISPGMYGPKPVYDNGSVELLTAANDLPQKLLAANMTIANIQ